MNTYTIYYLPAQQAAMLAALPFLNVQNADWYDSPTPAHFSLVQDLNDNQHGDCLNECQAGHIIGIKPGSNPGGSPNGCA